MDSAFFTLLTAIEEQQGIRYQHVLAREEGDRTSQQNLAKVVGHDRASGRPLVSVAGGGATGAVGLSNSSTPVGAIVSYFANGGDSVGFIDAIGSG
jgi:hypothetical protein